MLCLIPALQGCKNAKAMENELLLKSTALETPMFQFSGTKVTILIEGTDQTPAGFRVFNPSVASDVVNTVEPNGWQQFGMFLGGVGNGLMGAAVLSEPGSVSIQSADTNAVQVIPEPCKEK
jgi:hypothetical protein